MAKQCNNVTITWLGISFSSHFYSWLFMHGHVMAHLKYLKVFVALLLFVLHFEYSLQQLFLLSMRHFETAKTGMQESKRMIRCFYFAGKKRILENRAITKRMKSRMKIYRLVATEEKHHRIYAHCCCCCFRCQK